MRYPAALCRPPRSIIPGRSPGMNQRVDAEAGRAVRQEVEARGEVDEVLLQARLVGVNGVALEQAERAPCALINDRPGHRGRLAGQRPEPATVHLERGNQ